MKALRLVLGALLMIVLSIVPSVSAQEKWQETFCGNLEAADCALLRLSDVVMSDLQSVGYDAEMTVDVATESQEQFSMTVNASGVIATGQDQVDAVVDEILGMTIGEVLSLAEDHGSLIDTGLNYAERIVTAPEFSLQLDFEVMAPDETLQPVQVEMLLVDGVGYLRVPGMSGPGSEQWFSLDVVQLLNMVADFMRDPQLLEGMMSGMQMPAAAPEPNAQEGLDEAMSGGFGQFGELMEQINEIADKPYWEAMESPEFEARFVKMRRLADSEVNGVPVAVFETTLDYDALTETPEFQQAVTDILGVMASMSGEPMPENMVDLVTEIVRNQTTVVTQMVGLDDYYVYTLAVEGQQTIDPDEIVRAMGETPEEDLLVQTTQYQFTFMLSDHNQAPAVNAPNAEDVVSLLDLASGMMSPGGQGQAMPSEADDVESPVPADAGRPLFVPADWEEMDAGFPGLFAYTGPNDEFFMTGTIPAPASAVMPILVSNLGLDELPEATDEREINGVPWSFYEVNGDDGQMFFAVSTAPAGPTHLVVLAGRDDLRDTLYDSLYLAAVEAASE